MMKYIYLFWLFMPLQMWAEDWKLVWSEEFEVDGLPNPKVWNYEEGYVRNEEKQYYIKHRLKNSRVEHGVLVLEGHQEKVKNPKYQKDSEDWRENREFAHYTSASINTSGKVNFHYGKIEVRAKVPQGKGMWPAIWTLGQVGAWPKNGEIDIMEYFGNRPDQLTAAFHFADPKFPDQSIHLSAGKGRSHFPKPYDQFFVFSMIWDTDRVQIFVDDQMIASLELDIAGVGPDNPYRKPHYLLLNLAIGSKFMKDIDDAALPQRYEIDYIRYYKKDN